MYAASYKVADFIARGLAYAGGGILIVITLLTCASIAGRAFVPLDVGIGPIRGIYDITEIGMAAAVFAFLPWAQLRETHARVDLFQAALPRWPSGSAPPPPRRLGVVGAAAGGAALDWKAPKSGVPWARTLGPSRPLGAT